MSPLWRQIVSLIRTVVTKSYFNLGDVYFGFPLL